MFSLLLIVLVFVIIGLMPTTARVGRGVDDFGAGFAQSAINKPVEAPADSKTPDQIAAEARGEIWFSEFDAQLRTTVAAIFLPWGVVTTKEMGIMGRQRGNDGEIAGFWMATNLGSREIHKAAPAEHGAAVHMWLLEQDDSDGDEGWLLGIGSEPSTREKRRDLVREIGLRRTVAIPYRVVRSPRGEELGGVQWGVEVPEGGWAGVVTLSHTGYQKKASWGIREDIKYTHPDIAPYGLIETGEQFDTRVRMVQSAFAAGEVRWSDLGEWRHEVPLLSLLTRDTVTILADLGVKSRSSIPEIAKKKKPVVAKPRKIIKPSAEYDFSQQCLLYDMIPTLAAVRQAEGSLANPTGFSSIEGNPTSITEALFKRSKLAALLDLTPQQLALLVPQIKIYKVWYKDEVSKRNGHGEDIPINFDDVLSKEAVESITKDRKGRGAAAGLKSFTWSYDGQNFGDARASIHAKLDLHFQDLATFVDSGGPGEPGFIDLVWTDRPMSARQVELSKLIQAKKRLQKCRDIHNPGAGKIESQFAKTFDPEMSEIKVVVGWSVPQDPTGVIFKDSRIKKILEESREVLFMGLRDHTIKFNQDGTVDVAIDYIARLEGGMLKHKGTDILALGNKPARDELEKKLAGLSDKQLEASMKNDEGSKKITKKLTKEIKKVESQLKTIEKAQLSEKYSALISALIEQDAIHYFDADDVIIAEYVKSSDLERSDADRKKARKKLNKKFAKAIKAFGGKAHSTVASRTGQSHSQEGKKLLKYLSSEISDAAKVNKTRVAYFFFGDLLDVLMKAVPEKTRFQFLLGPLEYVDVNSRERNISLVDLPISFSLFRTWWNNTVSGAGGPRRSIYVVGNFIKDMLERLVFPAIGSRCTADVCRPEPELTAFTFSMAGISRQGPTQTGEEPVDPPIPIGTRIKASDDVMKNLHKHNKVYKSSNKFFHYYYIGASNKTGPGFGGVAHIDNAKGIYHLTLGADRGLVKEMNFSKSNQPHLAEMAIVGGVGAGQIQRLYEASINLFGSTLFQLGQWVHLNPSPIVMGSSGKPNSRIRMLGLGGYFLITGLNHTVDQNGFSTSLKCFPENVYGKVECCEAGGATLARLAYAAAIAELETSIALEEEGIEFGPPAILANPATSPGMSTADKAKKTKKAKRKSATRKRKRKKKQKRRAVVAPGPQKTITPGFDFSEDEAAANARLAAAPQKTITPGLDFSEDEAAAIALEAATSTSPEDTTAQADFSSTHSGRQGSFTR